MTSARLCECGCGRATSIATQTDRARGHVKGHPVRFIKGHVRKPVRTAKYRNIRATGVAVVIGDKRGYAFEHLIIATNALGRRLPKGAEVHHVDNNGLNNARTNLVICQDRAYHKLLHIRAHVRACGGDPNTQRICGNCGQPKAFAQFNRSRIQVNDGLTRTCKPCARALAASRNRLAEDRQRFEVRCAALVQELYDATTHLVAVLTFTHTAADLVAPELDYEIRRVLAARSALRRATVVSHVEAGLLEQPTLPAPFDKAFESKAAAS